MHLRIRTKIIIFLALISVAGVASLVLMLHRTKRVLVHEFKQEEKKEVELVWNGKTSEATNVVLPFQTIEVVDEPRAERIEDTHKQQDMFNYDGRGRQVAGWTNKLIWGDNKLVLSSLKSGDIAGGARKKPEARLGRSVVTKKNFLKEPEGKNRLKK